MDNFSFSGSSMAILDYSIYYVLVYTTVKFCLVTLIFLEEFQMLMLVKLARGDTRLLICFISVVCVCVCDAFLGFEFA